MTSLQFLGCVPLWAGVAIALLAGSLSYWLYRRETLRTGVACGRTIPLLRSTAIALIVLMLTGPTLQRRTREGEPSKLAVLVDDSASMSITDGQSENRFRRAVDGLLNPESEILKKLSENHEIQLYRGARAQATELWASTLEKVTPLPESASDWVPEKYNDRTELGETISQNDASAWVVLTDGRVNTGTSMVEAAQRLSTGHRPIFTVGYGNQSNISDIAISAVEHPDRLFRKDTLSGKVLLKDDMKPGQPILLQAWNGSQLLWEQALTTSGEGQRSIGYSFPIEKLVEQVSAKMEQESGNVAVQRAAVPVDIQWKIDDVADEADVSNNSRTTRFWGALHRARVLLVDGRSRWETRYLKNVFDRDPFWELNSVIVETESGLGGGAKMKRGSGKNQFPDSRAKLMEFDLVILGELNAGTLTEEEQTWLVDFVSQSGGGVLIVDGRRNAWSDQENKLLAELLPVERSSETLPDAIARSVRLTPSGRALAAMNIGSSQTSDLQEPWSELPGLHLAVMSTPQPGSEILASLGNSGDESNATVPLFVTKLFGSGRVLYSSSDETWRWRYKVADTIHQRFWNQMARWIMRTPFVIENEYASLDAGQMNYLPNQEVEFRCRLRDVNGLPLKDVNVEAIVQRDGQKELILPLTEDANVPGVYRGSASQLPSGKYTVTLSAAGLSQEALAISTEFIVAESQSQEMTEIASDPGTLRRVAEVSGGQYLPESQIDTLVELLKPLSKGRIIQSEILLWQSYWWFVPVIMLLSVEWWLRKRVGLI